MTTGPLSDLFFYGTAALLVANTIRRIRRPVDTGHLGAIAWVVLMDIPVVSLHLGYGDPPRLALYLTNGVANVAFLALQIVLDSGAFERFRMRLRAAVGEPGRDPARLGRRWVLGLAGAGVALAAVHWALMPAIPGLELLLGVTDAHKLAIDRENSAKLLAVPSIVKYLFTWNSRILLPVAFCGAILLRMRWTAVALGLFGLAYVMSPLEKFPAMLFVLAVFVALAVQARKSLVSPILVAGAVLSLVPPYAIVESIAISNSIQGALHRTPVAASSALPDQPGPGPAVTSPADQSPAPPVAPGPSETPAVAAGPTKPSLRPDYAIRTFFDLLGRRIGTGPAVVAYKWFAFFPAVHPYLRGSGWSPSKLVTPGYQSAANMVGQWAFYGRIGYDIPSISAYGSLTADGWAEFGYAGAIAAALGLVVLCLVLEAVRSLSADAFCVACYAPAALLVSVTPPQGGLPAIAASLGVFLVPLLCAAYVLSARRAARSAA